MWHSTHGKLWQKLAALPDYILTKNCTKTPGSNTYSFLILNSCYIFNIDIAMTMAVAPHQQQRQPMCSHGRRGEGRGEPGKRITLSREVCTLLHQLAKQWLPTSGIPPSRWQNVINRVAKWFLHIWRKSIWTVLEFN